VRIDITVIDPIEVKAVNKTKTGTQQKAKIPRTANNSAVSRQKKSEKPKKLYDQIIFQDWCKACGICSAFCPKKVIGRNEEGRPVIEHPDDCIGCLFCELHCPDFAITSTERQAKPQAN